MMDYIKRRFSASESFEPCPETSPQVPSDMKAAQSGSERSKMLLVIDNRTIDWPKYFKSKTIFADFTIHVEQAEFQDIQLTAYSNEGILIRIETYRNGLHVERSFRPDFVLVRQSVKDCNVDWMNLILGMQYGAVPSVNSMRALYNFRDKPWIFAELIKIQQRLGVDQFPLINQAYYPNHRKMFIPPQFPSILKIGQAHQGLGKMKIESLDDYRDVTSLVALSKCYSTIEPYISSLHDVCIQKIGQHYRAFSRKSLYGGWKANCGSALLEEIEVTERYRLWIDEVSQIFGGLDICAVQVIQSKNGKEYIIDINDCTMELIGETQEEDCEHIADLIRHRMQIYCRPDEEVTILKRISSYEELPQFPQNTILSAYPNGNIQKISNKIHFTDDADDTLGNLKKTFASIFGDL